jgi:VWFA-related protein
MFLLRFVCSLLLGLFLPFVSVVGQAQANRSPAKAAPLTPYPIPATSPLSSKDSVQTGIIQNRKIEFRTETILVQVPVVVTDKRGNHIRGLAKENFQLFENGKKQQISAFEEVVFAKAPSPLSAAKTGEFRNLTLSEQQPVSVIVLDRVNTPFLDQSNARRELVRYLANSLDSGQALALIIITSRGAKVVQKLTDDPQQLLHALKKVGGGLPEMHGIDVDVQAGAARGDVTSVPPVASVSDPATAIEAFIEREDTLYAGFRQAEAAETTMKAFLDIAWSLSGVPGRKSLIWATGGFPFTISSPETVPGGNLSQLYERTMAALTAAQISVYPVDVRGLVATNSVVEARRSRVRSGTPLSQISNRSWLQQSSLDTLIQFAEMTGGKAFFNTNDLAASFRRASDDASSYYLLSYYLDKSNSRAGWRELKVKVEKKDTEIRARKGFIVTDATIHPELTRSSDVNYALTSPIEATGVPITMKWSATSDNGGKKRTEFLLNVPTNGVATQATDGTSHVNFDVACAAFLTNSTKDDPVVTSDKTIGASLSATQMDSLRSSGIAMKDTLELGPGQYTVRVVVRDNITGKVGSVTAPLTVQ